MLRVVHANRVAALRDALFEALPTPPDPFAPATIVVSGHLVARWLTRELALQRGLAAGVAMPTLERFLTDAYTGDAAGRAAGLAALDRRALAVVLASALADPAIVEPLPAVRAYLGAAPDAGDRAGPRRVQLAERLADLYVGYAATRPDWMPALVVGAVPGELADDPAARWQAALLAAALARVAAHGGSARYAPIAMLPWLRRRAGLATPRVGPIAVFGHATLPRAYLEALSDLGAAADVTVYLLNPCQELWDDAAGRRGGRGDPLPLTLWGRPIRDTLTALIERSDGDLDGRFAEPPLPDSARARLLADVLARREAPTPADAADDPPPPGLAVLAAPSIRRELELVAERLRQHLTADPTLRAHDCAVWIAGPDAARYLAQAPAVFEAVGLPCHLIDAPLDDRGRIGEAVLGLLALPTGAMRRDELLRVMTHPAVLAAAPHVDAADWVRWTERLGIAHGADAAAHRATYLEAYPGHFHWDQGVRRLALGGFMVGERSGRPAVRVGDLDVLPEELRPDQQASAATYALLVRSLCADAAWLATHQAPLAQWATIFAGLVDAYLAPRDDDAARDLERVRAMLGGLAALDLDGRRLGFREAHAHAARRLTSARADRGEPLAAGVMLAPLTVGRALPAAVSCVVGLDEGGFPAGDTVSPLDLRRTPRAGDLSPRDRDRLAFFEALLGAERACYLSYVAVEPKSGEALAPSSVVLELADALAPYLGAPSSQAALAALTERHPLHRFSPRYDADAALPLPPPLAPAARRERWAAAARAAIAAHLRAAGAAVPDEEALRSLILAADQPALQAVLALAPLPAAPRRAPRHTLGLRVLRTFLESPIQAWASAVLGLDELPEEDPVAHSDEPFDLEPKDRAPLLREILEADLRDPRDLAATYDRRILGRALRGDFPVGVFGEASRTRDLAVLRHWRAALGPVGVGDVGRVAFGRARAEGATVAPALDLDLGDGRVLALTGQTELLLGAPGGRRTSVIARTSKADKLHVDHLRGALDHVALAAAGLAPDGHAHVLVDDEGRRLDVRHDPWRPDEARAYLRRLATSLFDEAHGYLLPFEVLVGALLGKPRAAREPLRFGPIKRDDGLLPPPDLAGLARDRLAPLVERMHGDHGFGGGDA
jgi:exodeoxyribonuclease V gamma subunit